MKPSQAKAAIKVLARNKRPGFIWGPPGIGKSDVVAQVAEEEQLQLRDVRANLMDPVDVRGFPMIKDGVMSWARPDWFPSEGNGILFLDELPAALPATQAAFYQLILNRRIGEHVLPEGWSVMAAGNRAGDRALVHEMSTALRSRFVHLDFEVDNDEWYAWATANNVSDVTRAFIKFRPALLHSFDPSQNERTFPSPRTWTFVDSVVGQGLDSATEIALIAGAVGQGAMAEYITFMRLSKDLPSADEIMLNPDTAPVPEEPGSQYAICTALDKRVTPNNIGRMLRYMERLPVDFQVLWMRSAAEINRAITKTAEYVTWLTKNQDVIV